MDREQKLKELGDLRQRVEQIESELAAEQGGEAEPSYWPAYYTAYYATTGFMLGMFAAMASLLFNVVGSVIVGQHPLEIIRVYLTFPLGDPALTIESGLALAIGVCLYLATGALLGIPIHLALTRWTANGNFLQRLALASVLALAIWVVNYYVLLFWLQPALVENISPENLIVRRVPPYVAALTHLVFGWTMVLLYPLGTFTPYRGPVVNQP